MLPILNSHKSNLRGLSIGGKDISGKKKLDSEEQSVTLPKDLEERMARFRGKRVLFVDNSDGKLKCAKCGKSTKKMCLTFEAYCPSCFF